MNDCRKCIHFEDVKILGVEKCHTKFGKYIEQGHTMDNAVLLNARELDIMLDKARADERMIFAQWLVNNSVCGCVDCAFENNCNCKNYKAMLRGLEIKVNFMD